MPAGERRGSARIPARNPSITFKGSIMKRWQKVVLSTMLVARRHCSLAGITATVGWRPFLGPKARPLTDRRFEPTPARLERGDYLVRNVTGCLFCHSELDPSIEGLPVKAGHAGAGRPFTAEDMPWLTAPNLTPDQETGAGAWTDDMLARAIREGIGHDGRTLFPMMPYQNYRQHVGRGPRVGHHLHPVAAGGAAASIRRPRFPFPVNRLINSVPAADRGRGAGAGPQHAREARRSISSRWPRAATATRRWTTRDSTSRAWSSPAATA